MVKQNQIVIFGAGKIGRSFIGQLFGCNGYTVVFIDIDENVIKGLNRQGSYRVIIKGEEEKEIVVPHVKAISSLDKDKVVEAVSTAGIMAISVGKNVLKIITPIIAGGLIARNKKYPGTPLDIILAENMRSAADFVKEHLKENLPSDFPMKTMVGLIETSIGKMVPIIPLAELKKDPLVVFAEAYNTLIVDRKGFKSSIPVIAGLAPKDHIKAWVDRKAFIHNLGHASAAYYGYRKHPEAVYMYEILEDREVLLFTREVMLQSANILKTVYPEDFTISDLENHIDDLILRFRNKALQDTIFRVGQDLMRKLGPDDRFLGAIHLAVQSEKPYDLILEAMSYGLFFTAKDETGNCSSSDLTFLNSLDKDIESTFTKLLHYDKYLDSDIIVELSRLYKEKGDSSKL